MTEREDRYPPVARYQAKVRKGRATSKDMTREVVDDMLRSSKALAGTGQPMMLAPVEVQHLIEKLHRAEATIKDQKQRLRAAARKLYGGQP